MPSNPKKGEKRSEFVSRCISSLTNEGEGKDAKQRAAICFSKWRKAKGGNLFARAMDNLMLKKFFSRKDKTDNN